MKLIRFLALGLLLPAQLLAQEGVPSSVILLIGDGVGVAYWTAARFEAGTLEVERFDIAGLVDTRASDSRVTDSAAGATAYAAGVKTYNGAIGVDADSLPVQTVLELAASRGLATGVVATSSVTHATPASFVAHVPSRQMAFAIAEQITASPPDVLLGGGLQYFHPQVRPDSANLLQRLVETHRVIGAASELEALDLGELDRLIGLFAPDAMARAGERTPSLPDMTATALQLLSRADDGFFLMVEGSQPDWFGHDNARLDLLTAEVLDFDRAIGVALDYQERHPETLVVVTADHETGGLALQSPRLWAPTGSALRGSDVDLSDGLGYHYTTIGHTAEMVPLFAKGPGAARFGGIRDNDGVGRLLLELVRDGGGRARTGSGR